MADLHERRPSADIPYYWSSSQISLTSCLLILCRDVRYDEEGETSVRLVATDGVVDVVVAIRYDSCKGMAC